MANCPNLSVAGEFPDKELILSAKSGKVLEEYRRTGHPPNLTYPSISVMQVSSLSSLLRLRVQKHLRACYIKVQKYNSLIFLY